MNILILVSSLDMGGAQKQAVVDANMLASSHNIHLGMFDSGETGGALRDMLDERIKVTVFRKSNYLSTAARLAKFLKEQKIQIVHCHLYAPMLVAGIASLVARVPVIWHFHGHHFEVRKFPLNLLSFLPSVKKIIFVSARLSHYFEQHYWFPKRKLAVVYNSSQSNKQALLKGKDEPLRIGFVGRLVGLKRVQYLIKLAAFLKEKKFQGFEVWIIGDGPERQQLEELSVAEGVTKEIKFLGFRADVENLYNQLDLFILPSEEEALSLALIDAHNCGLPCIAFDVGGNKEIVQDGETGYIVHSEAELQQKALQLCKDEELRQEMGGRAEEYAKIFSEQNHLQNLLNIYARYA